ncbi:hypothetical protein HYT57_00695 [Candidatus Woesearchaeota archaeon]|nr:hypothetical protein [Candidatus Woesearchaeota archaeon]
MKGLHRSLLVLLILISLSIAVLVIKPSQTGLVIHGNQDTSNSQNITKVWDFSNSEDYTYNTSEITLEGNKASLKQVTTINTWYETAYTDYGLVYTLYNPEDKTNVVNEEDGNSLPAKNDKLLTIFFESNLENGDKIDFSLQSGDPGEIMLCETNTMCNSPGYGLLSFNGTAGNYSITLSNLDAQKKSLNIKGEVKINYITSNKGNIAKAFFDASDKLSKISSKNGENFEISKNKILDIKFNNSIENNDTITMYIKSGSASEIYLCDISEECTSPGYGKVAYNGEEGWYNITLINLESPKSSFNLDPENVKIDFIKAVHKTRTENSSTSISYVKNSAIQTKDIKRIEDIVSIITSEELNNQSVEYKYSIDEGLIWSTIPNNVSELNINKIRFSGNLISNGNSTPVIKEIKLVYNKVVPKVYYEINASGLINISPQEPIIINSSNFLLNLTASEDVTNANISIREFTNSSMNILKPLRSFMDIDIDNNLKISLNKSIAEIKYTDNDISSNNINESTLKVYYYNESNSTWIPLSSEVDLANNVVKAVIPHFSIYGVFGSEISNSTPESLSNQTQSGQSQSNQEDKVTKISNTTELINPIDESEKVLEPDVQKQENQFVQDVKEPLNADEIIENGTINSTKEKGITGFTTKMNGIGMSNIAAIILVTVFLALYLIHKVHKIHKKQAS